MIAPDEADEPALDLDPVRTEYACFVSRIGGLQRNRGALATESLQGRFLVVDQRDDDIPGAGGASVPDDHRIAIEDAGLDHRIALDLESVVLAAADHFNRYGYIVHIVLD